MEVEKKTIEYLAYLAPSMRDRKVTSCTDCIHLILEMLQTKMVTIGLVIFKKSKM